MRDIGRMAGVSQSTVSRVLNDAQTTVRVADETRARIVQAARTLGYRPNPLARGLRGAQTMLIGAVVSDITDPFYGRAVELLSVEAIARGYNLVLGHAHDRADAALALTAILETRHCDAIVLLGDIQDQPRLLADLQNSVVPVVALWQGSSSLAVPTVDVDNRRAIRLGLEHLVKLGHKRVAFASGPLLGSVRERHDEFIAFSKRHFGGSPKGYVQQTPNTYSGGETAFENLVNLANPPTAIVASTDTLAIGMLHAAYSKGWRVPNDLSIVGFDDIALSSHTVPALTTIRMPMVEIATEGIQLAIKLAKEGRGQSAPHRVFRASLIIRQSTAPPRSSEDHRRSGSARA